MKKTILVKQDQIVAAGKHYKSTGFNDKNTYIVGVHGTEKLNEVGIPSSCIKEISNKQFLTHTDGMKVGYDNIKDEYTIYANGKEQQLMELMQDGRAIPVYVQCLESLYQQ